MPARLTLTLVQTRWFAALLTMTALCLWCLPESAHALRQPSANRECSTCHIMWLDEFKRKDVETLIPYEPLPQVETGKQDVASTEQMCFSCHDGFVLDSRMLWKKGGHNHPVGVKPSKHVRIPTAKGKTIFPLNKDGKVYCGTCHTAHGVDWKAKDSPIFMRLKNRNSSLCMACHLNRSTGPREGNHPVGKHTKQGVESLQQHHAKFGQQGEVICQSCHVVHGAKAKKILAISNEQSALCSSCHRRNSAVRSSKHNLLHKQAGLKNELGQAVSEAGPCSACHVPHNAEGPRLWARTLKAGKDLSSAYCLSCHQHNGVAGEKTTGAHSHPVDVPLRRVGIVAKRDGWLSSVNNRAVEKDMVRLPLFDKQGKQVREGGNVTCLSCHDPHLWSPAHAETGSGDVDERDGDGSNSFLRIANDRNSSLCTNCHRAQAPVFYSKHNLSRSAVAEKNAQGMTVSQSGPCSACHVPHNAAGARLWARISNAGGKGMQSLCVDCHRDGGVAEKRTTGRHSHPLHVSLARSGLTSSLPQFNSAGERVDRNGQVDCASCHDVHQWDPADARAASGLDPESDGDARNSFLRKKASGKAALCVDCHRSKKTLIGTDHDLSVTAADTRNGHGQTVVQSGPCGQCHEVHRAESSLFLWARSLATATDKDEALCLSCHSQDGPAHNKVPDELEHPDRVVPSNKGRIRTAGQTLVAPVFNRLGKPANAGRISCITCHNPHRWDAKSADAGSGVNEEGDVSNSFLRHASSENFLCADCHGVDSLYRYKYFHWSKSRADQNPEK